MDPNPTPFIGQVICFAGKFEPEGWMFCDGRILPIRDYEALFSLIGIYGGDEKVTFALPDLRDREPKQKESGLSGPRYIIYVKGDFPQRPNK